MLALGNAALAVRAGCVALAALAAGDAEGIDDGPLRSALLAAAVAASPERDRDAMDHLRLTEQALVWPTTATQVRLHAANPVARCCSAVAACQQ